MSDETQVLDNALEDGSFIWLGIGIALGLVLVTGFCCATIQKKRAYLKEQEQKASVFMYLQQFNVQDIDLRKSPPGGWHGTYMRKLAYGINSNNTTTAFSDDSSSSSTTRGSYVSSSRIKTMERTPLTHSNAKHLVEDEDKEDGLFLKTHSPAKLGETSGGDQNELDEELGNLEATSSRQRQDPLDKKFKRVI